MNTIHALDEVPTIELVTHARSNSADPPEQPCLPSADDGKCNPNWA